MRVLYGVMGEGLGHAMRARVISERLCAEGHSVRIFTSGRAVNVLRRYHDDVIEIDGLFLRYAQGCVKRWATLVDNLWQMPARLKKNAARPLTAARGFNPDIVITDFESFAHLVGWLLDLPIISLDHQHVVSMFHHPGAVCSRLPRDFFVTTAFISAKTPCCDHYIVTSFFFPAPKQRHEGRVSLVGPIVRPELATVHPITGDHVLVYQTASGDPALFTALADCQEERFVVYGAADCNAAQSKNIKTKKFSEEGFIEDIASARAVITNGGFTTIGEAIYLSKPVLSVPLLHQGEQQLNAAYLEALGMGACALRPTGEAIRGFLQRLDLYYSVHDPRLRTGADDAIASLKRAIKEVLK